jgi:hypothetical protein
MRLLRPCGISSIRGPIGPVTSNDKEPRSQRFRGTEALRLSQPACPRGDLNALERLLEVREVRGVQHFVRVYNENSGEMQGPPRVVRRRRVGHVLPDCRAGGGDRSIRTRTTPGCQPVTSEEVEGDLAHRSEQAGLTQPLPNSHDVYWVPRSECTTGPAGLRRQRAISRASTTSSVRR